MMRMALFTFWILFGAALEVVPLHAQSIVVQPYIQPGDQPDSTTIIWLTDQAPGDFTVEYSVRSQPVRTATPERVTLDFGVAKRKAKPSADADEHEKNETSAALPEKEQHYFKYTATLPTLPADNTVDYRVKLGTKLVRGGTFVTRASSDKPVRCVIVGDLAKGNAEQNAVAYQISRVQPQFLVALGDIVYPTGRVSQYMDHFWSTYNQPPIASEANGAPLMASVPFHVVLGNHDVDTHNLTDTPDVLGAYHFFRAPLNGPGEGPWSTPIGKSPEASAFRVATGSSYPALGVYSFENGPAHFLVLDNSGYVDLSAPKLREWIEHDLRNSPSPWKFVCCHAPAFHSSREHYTEQKMRTLVPLLESCGVDIVFSGHVHNYQRTVPLRFNPAAAMRIAGGLVNGDFKLDKTFDGISNTRADGIIHIVTGGGGGTLYKGELAKNAEYFQSKHPGNWMPYTVKFVSDRHSFTVVELSANRLLLRAMDATGAEFDRFTLTKAAP